MSTWRTLLAAYVLGGITFVPLLVVLAFFYFTTELPVSSPVQATTDDLTLKVKEDVDPPLTPLPSPPIRGWMTVRRTFDEVSSENQSYVGNLMRSFLDSKQSVSSTTSNGSSATRKPIKDTFYAVLKGTVLYLYENESCSDCYAALQVSSYDVDVFHPSYAELGRAMTDGELWAKRNAIRLRAKSLPSTPDGISFLSKDTSASGGTPPLVDEQHFLFFKSIVAMEDWYHNLLTASLPPSTLTHPKPYEEEDMARLVASLDSQPDPIPMRWLNALIGRLFFAVYKTSALEASLVARLHKKLAKVPRPAFLTDIVVREVSVGDSAPLFSKPMLKELTKEGDASVEVGLNYASPEGVRLIVEATVTIDVRESLPLNLGNRFDVKPRIVKLVLAVVLRSIEGNLLIKVKRPPSNRVWYGFTHMPKMEIQLLPIVSDRKIKWGMVLKPIENLLREVIQDSVVLPNMDDVPFFDTERYAHRGGVFSDAVRTSYDLSSSSTAAPDTMVDGINTVSPSTSIPTSADMREEDDGVHLPGDYHGRTGTSVSLPASLSSQTSKRGSWLSRFGKGGKEEKERTPEPVILEQKEVPTPAVESTEEEVVAKLEGKDHHAKEKEKEKEEPKVDVPPGTTISEGISTSPSTISLTSTTTRRNSQSMVPSPSASTSGGGRIRSTTMTHHSVQSAAGDFYSPPNASSTSSPLAPSPLIPSASSSSSTSETPIPTPPEGSTASIPLPASSSKSLPSSPMPNSSTNPNQTATQALLSAWKNRATDKQVLANTARDVARDAMKKWGWQKKDDAGEKEKDKSEGGSRPSTPEKKTYEQLKAEVGLRHAPSGSLSMSPGSTSSLASAAVPGPSSSTNVQRRISNASDSALGVPAVPVQRQPMQAATMRIPGIHASHRGEVMAMGSPLPPPPPEPETNSQLSNGTGLQNVYRFFKKDASLEPTPSLKSQSSGDALRGQTSRDDLRSSIPPPLPARPLTSGPMPDPPPISEEYVDPFEPTVTHERKRTGSSAASALKQIQAEDAARQREEKESVLDPQPENMVPDVESAPPVGALNAMSNGDLHSSREPRVAPDPVIL